MHYPGVQKVNLDQEQEDKWLSHAFRWCVNMKCESGKLISYFVNCCHYSCAIKYVRHHVLTRLYYTGHGRFIMVIVCCVNTSPMTGICDRPHLCLGLQL